MNNLFVDPKIVWDQVNDPKETDPITPVVEIRDLTMETVKKLIDDAEHRAVKRAKRQDVFANVMSIVALLVAVFGVIQVYL